MELIQRPHLLISIDGKDSTLADNLLKNVARALESCSPPSVDAPAFLNTSFSGSIGACCCGACGACGATWPTWVSSSTACRGIEDKSFLSILPSTTKAQTMLSSSKFMTPFKYGKSVICSTGRHKLML